jgi:hypothetical protein
MVVLGYFCTFAVEFGFTKMENFSDSKNKKVSQNGKHLDKDGVTK